MVESPSDLNPHTRLADMPERTVRSRVRRRACRFESDRDPLVSVEIDGTPARGRRDTLCDWKTCGLDLLHSTV